MLLLHQSITGMNDELSSMMSDGRYLIVLMFGVLREALLEQCGAGAMEHRDPSLAQKEDAAQLGKAPMRKR